jgi:ubiquinone/menaquinone biosynthesis C-methylase UbiE
VQSRSDPVPPQELFRHRDDYLAVAQRMFDLLVDLTGVGPDDRVLDVGCGAGRLATPLARYLGPDGSYEGFDNNAERIAWCNEHIGGLHPHMRFSVANVYNGQYNREATLQAEDFTFPYDDGEFDVVFLMSVFTHMLPPGVTQYMGEIARVLKPGGRSMITWFILNEESERLIDEQRDRRRDPAQNAHDALLSHDFGVYRTTDPKVPEYVIAYQESFVRDTYSDSGLEVVEPVYYGGWSGRTETRHNQDVVVARRP